MIGEKFAFTIKLFMNTANESQKENNFIPRRPSSPKGFESTIPNTIQYNTLFTQATSRSD